MYADITIKAHCTDPAKAEHMLLENGASYVGLDVQTDTYYKTDYGKLKHRQGNIENVLIHYKRTLRGEAKQTKVLLYLNQEMLQIEEDDLINTGYTDLLQHT